MILDFVFRGSRIDLLGKAEMQGINFFESTCNGKKIICFEEKDMGFYDWDQAVITSIDYGKNQIIRLQTDADMYNAAAMCKLLNFVSGEQDE